MKCKICGAKLRKEGDICKACYEEYCKEEALENDKNEVFKLYRKYMPKYQLTRYYDGYIIYAMMMGILLYQKQFLFSIIFTLLAILLLVIALLWERHKAVNTICIFYEKKVVFRYKSRKKVIAYDSLKNVTYFQNFFQKIFDLGDIQFTPDSGTYLLSGFEIKNVPNIKQNWEKLSQIVQLKEED